MKFEIFRQSHEDPTRDKPTSGASWNKFENRWEIHFTDLNALCNFASREGCPVLVIPALHARESHDIPILEIQDLYEREE